MRYKIKVEVLAEGKNYSGEEIYEQVVEDLDLSAVIKAANKFNES